MNKLIKVKKEQLESLIEERKQLQAEKAELLDLLQEIELETGSFIGQFLKDGKINWIKIKDIVTPMMLGGFGGGNLKNKVNADGIIAVQGKVSETLEKYRQKEQEDARRSNKTRAIDGATETNGADASTATK